MNPRAACKILGPLILLICSGNSASGWVRYYAPDDELIDEADVVVVGHIDAGFKAVEIPQGVSRDPKGQVYHFLEYRTVLVVKETLKGDLKPGEVPMLIHYGTRPVVLKDKPSVEDIFNPTAVDEKTGANTPVGIFDSATTQIGGPPTDNVRKDHLWFLHTKGRGMCPQPEFCDALGLWSPQDVQPFDKKAYYLAVMAGNPEGLSPWVSGDSWPARQARITQARLLVKKLKALPGEERAMRLAEYYDSLNKYSSAGDLALNALLDMGEVGEAKLLPLFRDKPRDYDRRWIIQGLERKDYRSAAPVMLAWLEKENVWWATKTKDDLRAAYAGQKGGDPYNDARAVSFRNIYCTIQALGAFQAGEAKPAIRNTRECWAKVGMVQENNDIVGLCDSELNGAR